MCYNRSGCLKVQSLWGGWRKKRIPLPRFLELCRDDSPWFCSFGQLGNLPLIHLQDLRIANPAKYIADFRAFPHLCSTPLTPNLWTSQLSCYSHLYLNSKGKPIDFQSSFSLSIYISSYSLVPHSCSPKSNTRDFPSGLVVKTSCSQCRGHGFNPWLGK